jgi:hypothetical protein
MNISKGESHLVSLYLLGGTAYQLGQVIKGVFDFSLATVACCQEGNKFLKLIIE